MTPEEERQWLDEYRRWLRTALAPVQPEDEVEVGMSSAEAIPIIEWNRAKRCRMPPRPPEDAPMGAGELWLLELSRRVRDPSFR